jgi:hypothetical protein
MVEPREAMNIAASGANHLAGGVTLDALFRANAAARPGAIALADPSDRASFTDGAPRRLTYAEADQAVERLAARLQSFGLPAGSVVALQLPNVVESVLTLLAILRAGLIAAPVPMLWRRSDLVSALAPVEPKVLIALARFGEERPAETVCETAADLFSLSFPCAFGANVPDGVIALDQDSETPSPSATRITADGVSIMTFDAAAEGFFAAARNDAQLLAAGLAVLLEAGIESGDTIIATVPGNSLAGVGGAIVPWLLSGGTLELIQGMSPVSVATAGQTSRVHVLAPAAVLPEIVARRPGAFASCIAAHRGRTSHRDLSFLSCGQVVDLFAFGEIGIVAVRRESGSRPEPVPLGPISAPAGAPGGPVVIETRVDDGRVLLRGPMVPTAPYPSEFVQPRLKVAGEGFVPTGYRCRSNGNGAFTVEAGPERVVSVGALRFGLDDLRTRFSACGDGIRVAAVEDALLGQRLRIDADDPAAAAAALQAAGHSRLVVDAVLRDTHPRPAAG